MDEKPVEEKQCEQESSGINGLIRELNALSITKNSIDADCKEKNEIVAQNAASISFMKKGISDLSHHNIELADESKLCMDNFNQMIEKFRQCGYLYSAFKQKNEDHYKLLEEKKVRLHKVDARAQDILQNKKDLNNFQERLIQDFEERKKELLAECQNQMQELLLKKQEQMEYLCNSRDEVGALKLMKEELTFEISKCQENLTELEDFIQNLESCGDELDKKLENYGSELSSIDNEINDLHIKLINLQEVNDNAELEDEPTYQKLRNLVNENENVDLQLAEANLPNEIKDLKLKIEQLKMELNSHPSVEDLKLQLETSDQKQKAVKVEIKSLGDKISELNYEEDADLPERVKSIEQKIKEVSMEMATTEQESEICKKKCSVETQQYDELFQKCQDMEKQKQDGECKKVNLQQQFEELQMKKQKSTERLSTLDKECCLFRKKIDDVKKMKEDIDIKILAEDLMGKTMIEEYETQVAAKEAKQMELLNQISSYRYEMSILFNKNRSYRENTNQIEREIEENSRKDSQLNEKLMENEKRLSELDKDIEEKKLKLPSLKERQEQLTANIKFQKITLKNIKDSDDERIKNYYMALQSLNEMAKSTTPQ